MYRIPTESHEKSLPNQLIGRLFLLYPLPYRMRLGVFRQDCLLKHRKAILVLFPSFIDAFCVMIIYPIIQTLTQITKI